jgi:primosomal protein N'
MKKKLVPAYSIKPSLYQSLWRHQMESIKIIQSYLLAHENGKTRGSVLIHLPSGSGKTEITGAVASCTSDLNCVLVLTPRSELRDKLHKEVGGVFFEKAGSQRRSGSVQVQSTSKPAKVEAGSGLILLG